MRINILRLERSETLQSENLVTQAMEARRATRAMQATRATRDKFKGCKANIRGRPSQFCWLLELRIF